ncbi:MAG: sigma 54-interacting transcriptional regulator [Bryobacterales bacterium]|nr:sigma 54-interacting transcriptional regulator [Bryobacterales bacterium]
MRAGDRVSVLTAIAGPLRGAAFAIGQALTIGRSRQNDLTLDDRLVSRRHCRVEARADGVWLVDLESENGTHRNGAPVKETKLAAGDELRIGQSVFVCGSGTHTVAIGPQADSTVILKVDDSPYLKIDSILEPTQRVLSDVKVLLGIGAALPAAKGLDDVRQTLLGRVAQALPAESVHLILNNEEIPEQIAGAGRALIEQVRGQQVGVLSELGGGALAAPLIAFRQLVGVIYAEAVAGAKAAHLDLLAGIAGIAAPAVESAMRLGSLEQEKTELERELGIAHDMVGASEALAAVLKAISRAAPTDASVLILGESGTGKELAARALHRNSPRSKRRFVAINCAAIPEPLIEAELFGHERGAFTGAMQQRRGRIEDAFGGTLFLDEIGELAPSVQAKLLRFLQEREFQRIGGTRPIAADVRVIAASNRDLESMVRHRTFREDLYYRLHVISVVMPPLRDRAGDVALLAEYFVDKHRNTCSRRVAGVSRAALRCLREYSWPGNVRELENAIQRAMVMGTGAEIMPEDLPETILESAQAAGAAEEAAYHEEVRKAKQRILQSALDQAKGNISEAARRLGLHPNNLHRMMKSLGVKARS